ncbi:MAG: NADH-ubiquinone oxidoreductase-F iron-sulfur binding region domain-containing protein [Endomicrobiaceae bacterium]|jgi:NADH-quinone oxidoreductase subunit F|nr:NADH-ubiquinone oxidoreductase-F iron-sulfur binding region domain-containing protein [Endomicrobiaceae bacterium]MDD3729853.1 NADH-ubiquinone oxidoreductase-F iron-sulfur binding region domain-containing protein [Endomicrobiaceae bacterium]MDD4166194.1 NADH-ubiquinone oxidoreductase-F iron-sulfur binding region domain-containing protein [Endomicrobiaceae bacterium]
MIDLDKITNDVKASSKNIKKRIILCAGTGCVANGALKVYDTFMKTAANMKIDVCIEFKKEESTSLMLSKSGCQGFCQMGPLVALMPDNILYTKVKVEDVKEILEKSIIGNEIIDRLCYTEDKKIFKGPEEIPFYKRQHRFVIKKCGFIGAEDIEEYISLGGYSGAKKACLEMSAEEICKTMIDSGLRGRGGGGFPTGRKWDLTRIQPEPKKYVICNGDEGDPGAFMDRSVLEGNPHSVIEGMIIAAKAIGADEGYVYVRTEYHLAVERMKSAIKKATEYGILGEKLFGSDHNFILHVMEGAGAFVCGEETALIASIEGKRGMPKPKPPFPAQSGLRGKPTVINNVETLATVPLIIKDGADKFKSVGVATSTGTKTFALTGHVKNTGLIEVPFGSTLRQIIFDIAGGVTNDKGEVEEGAFKAVQIGGPSGGCLTKEHLDLPLDFDSLRTVGAMVGSGGLVVMNQTTCMVSVAKFFMQFTQNESCGKCVLCREGTRQMLLMLEDITEGRATPETIPLLEKLAHTVRIGSLCGLGKTAPNPVLSTLKYFRHEYDAHVKEKKCPAGSCTSLVNITIDPDKCIGCTVCAMKCPVKAIKGDKKQKHVIEQSLCVKCGVCIDACKFKAIKRG